jgi:hypothetical protein
MGVAGTITVMGRTGFTVITFVILFLMTHVLINE